MTDIPDPAKPKTAVVKNVSSSFNGSWHPLRGIRFSAHGPAASKFVGCLKYLATLGAVVFLATPIIRYVCKGSLVAQFEQSNPYSYYTDLTLVAILRDELQHLANSSFQFSVEVGPGVVSKDGLEIKQLKALSGGVNVDSFFTEIAVLASHNEKESPVEVSANLHPNVFLFLKACWDPSVQSQVLKLLAQDEEEESQELESALQQMSIAPSSSTVKDTSEYRLESFSYGDPRISKKTMIRYKDQDWTFQSWTGPAAVKLLRTENGQAVEKAPNATSCQAYLPND